MHKLLKQAFTLIELLVVIAIIGILSGLIIVGMNGMIKSANIAKSQVFSNSLRNSLMMNIVGEWKFDNIPGTAGSSLADGTQVPDSWSTNNGSTSGIPTLKDGKDCVSGKCLYFNGSNVVSIPDVPAFNFGSNASVFYWTNGVAGAAEERYILSQCGSVGNYGFLFGKSSSGPGKINLYIYDDGTGNNNHWKNWITNNFALDGAWHHIGFTWNAGVALIYIDGQSVVISTSGTLTSNVIFNSTANLSIGGSSSGSHIGSMDDVIIYNATIPTSQIKEQYYAGLNKLLANGAISVKEYTKRIEESKLSIR